MTTAEAYAACERLAAAHYENFPVASRLLPRQMRPHVAAIYVFARVADDFADEGQRPESERQRLLDDWLARLRACAMPGAPAPAPAPHVRSPGAQPASGVDTRSRDGHERPAAGLETERRSNTRPLDQRAPPATSLEIVSADPDLDPDSVFLALGETIRVCRLPVTLFEDLIDAFRQDITTHRYGTWDEVIDYCRRSANPVGRLVLRVAGYDDPSLDAASDALCTALQLTNFWQDLDRDYQLGRLYVPRADLDTSGAAELDLTARSLTPAWGHLLRELSARTRALFERGRPICDAVAGRLRYQLRFTWLGGCRILERLEETGFDVFNHRPALGASDLPVLLWRAARWRRRPAS